MYSFIHMLVVEAGEEIRAARLQRGVEHGRVGEDEVRRRHGVTDLPHGELELLARLLVHVQRLVHQVDPAVQRDQVGLLDGVEVHVLVPGRVVEPRVLRVGLDHGLVADAQRLARRVAAQPRVVAGELGLQREERVPARGRCWSRAAGARRAGPAGRQTPSPRRACGSLRSACA